MSIHIYFRCTYSKSVTLTNGVADLEPVLRGPGVVDFGVVLRRDDPTVDAANLELKGSDREEVEGGEGQKQQTY